MKILLTNDDGFDAPGLLALHRAVRQLGDVTVVAPARCHSSKGHAVCTREPICVDEHQHPEMGTIFAAHASPADSVRVGFCQIMPTAPDIVVAGINPGANLGVDVYYSGTVAAAREAAILGCRAFAVSSYMRQDVPLDWDEQTEIAATTIESLLGLPTDAGQFWNVNFPAVPAGETPGPLLFTRQSTEPQTVAYEPAAEASRAYRFSGDYSRRPANQEADVRAVFAGHVSATLLQLDTSVHVPHQLSTDQTGASPANQD